MIYVPEIPETSRPNGVEMLAIGEGKSDAQRARRGCYKPYLQKCEKENNFAENVLTACKAFGFFLSVSAVLMLQAILYVI